MSTEIILAIVVVVAIFLIISVKKQKKNLRLPPVSNNNLQHNKINSQSKIKERLESMIPPVIESLERTNIYRTLKSKCDSEHRPEVLVLIRDVGEYSINKLRTVIKNMPEYTLHDETHIFDMLSIVDMLLSKEEQEKLTIPDIMMIIISIFLHDIGMAPDEKYIKLWKNLPYMDNIGDWNMKKEKKDFDIFRTSREYLVKEIEILHAKGLHAQAQMIEDYIITEYIRKNHALRAKEMILKDWNGKIVYKYKNLTEDLCDICFSHNESSNFIRKMEKFKLCDNGVFVCLPFVAVILRLCDIIDFDQKRTPEVLFAHLNISNPVSLDEWKKHLAINAWTKTSDMLIYSAECEHPVIEATIMRFCDMIDTELRECDAVLSRLSDEGFGIDVATYKIKLPKSVNRDTIRAKRVNGNPIYISSNAKFILSHEKIMTIFMGKQLYGDDITALRELIQNSIDACQLRAVMHSGWGQNYTPKITISYFSENGAEYLQVEDNGVGMNQEIIEKYYTNIGVSYYRSEEYRKLLNEINGNYTSISRYGIGVLSCFMICDSIYLQTKRLKSENDCDPALNVSIESRDSLFILTSGNLNHPGTITRLKLMSDKKWSTISQDKSLEVIVSELINNPPFEFEIIEKGKKSIKTKLDLKNENLSNLESSGEWRIERYKDCISVIEIELGDETVGFIGKAKVAFIKVNGKFLPKYDTENKMINIDSKDFKISNSICYGKNCFRTEFSGIKVNKKFEIEKDSSTSWEFKSDAVFSLHGMTIKDSLFVDGRWYYSRSEDWQLVFPFPTIMKVDICGNNDVEPTTGRNKIINDEKWIQFKRNLFFEICKKISEVLTPQNWNELKYILLNNMQDENCKDILKAF